MSDNPFSDGAAFYLAPSLVQAMQRMPDAFPEVLPASDTTRKTSISHDNMVEHKNYVPGNYIENKPEALNSFNNASTSEDSGQASAKGSSSLGEELMNLENKVDKLERSLDLLLLVTDDVVASTKKKFHELGELRKSDTELRQTLLDVKKELAEAQEKLKKKDIYTKSLDEYVDELEAKIGAPGLLRNKQKSARRQSLQRR